MLLHLLSQLVKWDHVLAALPLMSTFPREVTLVRSQLKAAIVLVRIRHSGYSIDGVSSVCIPRQTVEHGQQGPVAEEVFLFAPVSKMPFVIIIGRRLCSCRCAQVA
jgi:hypothetical protein